MTSPFFKRMFDALFKSLIFFALVHVLILIMVGFKTRDFSVLNVFNVFQVDLLFTVPFYGFARDIISTAVLVAVYCLFLFL